jgi:6-pyruvoyltetrahydropterin/6-carboxytetrahydropterin synthase
VYTIAKTFTFDAAHQLKGLPEGHKCGNMHGHTYTVTAAIQGRRPDENGWLIDFTDFAPFKDFLDLYFDHKFLNDAVAFQTTSENLARYLFEKFIFLVKLPDGISMKYVRVSETPSTYAEYLW